MVKCVNECPSITFANGIVQTDFTIYTLNLLLNFTNIMSMFFYIVYDMDVHEFVDAYNDGLRVANIPVGSLSYADDIVLMSTTKKGLDRMMYNMNAYGRMWRLSYSATKTKYLVFGENKSSKRSLLATRSWYMGNKPIEECLDIVHLGIILDTRLNTTIRIKDVYQRQRYFLQLVTGWAASRCVYSVNICQCVV